MDEIRGQVDNYATLGMSQSTRGFGLILAVVMGLGQLWLGAVCVVHIGGQFSDFMLTPKGIAVLGLTGYLLAAGSLFFPLGWLVYRGNKAAMVAVMSLWTIFVVLMNSFGWRSLPLRQDAMLIAVSLVGWAMCLHAFYRALSVERKRPGAA
jgi:hypothetical protein